VPTQLADEAGPTHDEDGVDRTLIRVSLALTPVQRLERLEQFVESIWEIRELNAKRAVR